jgi:hypothetical protein
MVAAVVAKCASAAFHLDMVDAMNAQHAKDYAGCTKGETAERSSGARRSPPG